MESEVETNKGRRDHGTMIALGSQKELKSNGLISGKDNRYATSKNGRRDLKIEICVSNKYGLASCKNWKVKGDSEKNESS